MKSYLKVTFSLFFLVGCIHSSYPLIKKEESVSLVSAGQYCFVPSHVTVIQDSQCGWLNIRAKHDNGYTFKVIKDSHKTLTDAGSSIKKGESQHARILNTPLKSGALKGWHVLQSCASASKCDYFAVAQRQEGVFDVAVTPSPKQGHSTRVDSKAALLSKFANVKKLPTRIVRFYSPKYLTDKAKKRAEKQRLIKEQNQGDL